MNGRGAYKNVKFTKPDSRSPSGAEPDVSYAELHFKMVSTPQVRTDRDGLNPTYSELNFRKEKPRFDEHEDPPISSGPRGPSTTAETDDPGVSYAELQFKTLAVPRLRTNGAAQVLESKVKIGNRPYCLICLLCLVTSALIVMVAGLTIHVLQIHQSESTFDQNYHELNSTLPSKISEISHPILRLRTCLQNLSALNSHLSVLKRMHSDPRHQFTEMETKHRSFNETKAQICEWLTSGREQRYSQDWIRNEDRCYFISTLATSYDEAKERCSNLNARLLEINSKQEENVVSNALVHPFRIYWIGNCEDGKEASSLMVKDDTGTSVCGACDSPGLMRHCNHQHRFICEKPARLLTDIPEMMQDLCQ